MYIFDGVYLVQFLNNHLWNKTSKVAEFQQKRSVKVFVFAQLNSMSTRLTNCWGFFAEKLRIMMSDTSVEQVRADLCKYSEWKIQIEE